MTCTEKERADLRFSRALECIEACVRKQAKDVAATDNDDVRHTQE